MIHGQLSKIEFAYKFLPTPLIKALDYLRRTDFLKVEPGKYELEGDKVFAIVQDYQTEPKMARRAETHRKYIDIQFVASGAEKIGYAPVNPANPILEDCLREKDALFYKSVRDEMELIVKEGDYAIFFPEDVHRPCCDYLKPEVMVKKVVLKVAVDLVDSYENPCSMTP